MWKSLNRKSSPVPSTVFLLSVSISAYRSVLPLAFSSCCETFSLALHMHQKLRQLGTEVTTRIYWNWINTAKREKNQILVQIFNWTRLSHIWNAYLNRAFIVTSHEHFVYRHRCSEKIHFHLRKRSFKFSLLWTVIPVREQEKHQSNYMTNHF